MTNLSQKNRGENVYYRLDIDNIMTTPMPEAWRTDILVMRMMDISIAEIPFTQDPEDSRRAWAYWEEETGLGCVKWMNWYPPREVL